MIIHDFFSLNTMYIDAASLKKLYVHALKERRMVLEHQHKIHSLVNEQSYLFYKHFHIDIDESIANGTDPPSVDQLLADSRKLEKEILLLSN